ncbi:MAG TPA: FAD-dependent oxidoreductase [Ilumatobacter sp.]|nr:FAD-dependent oxidoreductase [Ilumatobacter sp.]
MTASRAVIVGAGLGGVQTAHWLRAGGYDGEIVLIGDEPDLPYHRPPLSKHAHEPDEPLDVLRSEAYYRDHAIDLRRGVTVESLDVGRRSVTLAGGEAIGWDYLVLATGAAPRRLAAVPSELDGVHVLRTAGDARALWARPLAGASIAVVGAGFVGLEFAAAATVAGARVTVVELADRVLARVVSPTTSESVDRFHRQLGVDVRLSEQVVGIDESAGAVTAVTLGSGARIGVDGVLVAVGAVPRVDLAVAAGLAIDDGIAVDSRLRASAPGVYAIGDCASWRDEHGVRRRLESIQNAGDQAAHVAATILGADRPFSTTPWFWSDQGGLRLQIAGVPAPGDAVVQVGESTTTELTVLHHDHGRLTCVETLGRPGDHLAGRRLVGKHVDVGAVAGGRATLRELAKSAQAAA